MIVAHHHIRNDWPVFAVHTSKLMDAFDGNTRYLRNSIDGIILENALQIVIVRANLNAIHFRNVLDCRILCLQIRNRLIRIGIPHCIRVYDGRLAGSGVNFALGGLHAQIAHPQEHSVFFYQERRVRVVSDELDIHPIIVDEFVDHTKSQSAVRGCLDRNIPVRLR